MRQRKGFTLIELVVALAVLSILIYMAFASFSIVSAVSASNQNREAVLEDTSTVLDQLTKELRQTTTVSDSIGGATQDGGRFTYGVTLPPSLSTDSSNALGSIVSFPVGTSANPNTLAPILPALGLGQTYRFRTNTDAQPNGIILEFFTLDTTLTPAVKHRIRYSLTAAANGLAQQFWPDSHYEPCQIIYSNETYSSTTSTWTGVTRQPVTGQVITNFTVIRPAWSAKVIQIVLQAMVRNGSGSGSTTITRIAQISLRQ